MKLAIISHTEHYTQADGTIVGWGPTISEINHLSKMFDDIYHIAFLHDGAPPPSSLPYTSSQVKFIPLPPSGGRNLKGKLSVFAKMPTTLSIIHKALKEVDAFQFRAPVGMGIYVIPYLTLFCKKKGWFKYAGNWNQKSAPMGYAFQRWLLKRQSRIVTINGRWDGQSANWLTFENPCLTQVEREEGLKVISARSYNPPFSFCFVGRLEDEKGVQRILDAFGEIESMTDIGNVHFIGDGKKMAHYKEVAMKLGIPAIFHGFLSRDKVFEIYRESTFLILPTTASEGFPKVIAEAMNFGCIPIVSNISSIGQYITEGNGYIVDPVTSQQLQFILNKILIEASTVLMNKAIDGYKTASNFRFDYYNERIISEILGEKVKEERH